MRFIDILLRLKSKLFPAQSVHANQVAAPQKIAASVANGTSEYARHIRAQFNECVDLCNAFTREQDVDAVSRIHPSLAVNLKSTLQLGLYTKFFAQAKDLIIDLGNFPQTLSGPAFGTDFVSFEQWARCESRNPGQFPSNLSGWQPFINLVCAFVDVLSNPAASLATGKLSPDMALLAEVALKNTKWDRPECLPHMHKSALAALSQLRPLIKAVIPEVFWSEHEVVKTYKSNQ